jgi:hypothetical protein
MKVRAPEIVQRRKKRLNWAFFHYKCSARVHIQIKDPISVNIGEDKVERFPRTNCNFHNAG